MARLYYEDFGCCSLCKLSIEEGPVVVAGIKHDELSSFAHAQCWVDAGRPILTADQFGAGFVKQALSDAEWCGPTHEGPTGPAI